MVSSLTLKILKQMFKIVLHKIVRHIEVRVDEPNARNHIVYDTKSFCQDK